MIWQLQQGEASKLVLFKHTQHICMHARTHARTHAHQSCIFLDISLQMFGHKVLTKSVILWMSTKYYSRLSDFLLFTSTVMTYCMLYVRQSNITTRSRHQYWLFESHSRHLNWLFELKRGLWTFPLEFLDRKCRLNAAAASSRIHTTQHNHMQRFIGSADAVHKDCRKA